MLVLVLVLVLLLLLLALLLHCQLSPLPSSNLVQRWNPLVRQRILVELNLAFCLAAFGLLLLLLAALSRHRSEGKRGPHHHFGLVEKRRHTKASRMLRVDTELALDLPPGSQYAGIAWSVRRPNQPKHWLGACSQARRVDVMQTEEARLSDSSLVVQYSRVIVHQVRP